MKSKFFAMLLIAVMLVLCAACDNGAVHSEDLVLKNGTVITPEIRAKLESMRPEADAVLASIIGEETVSRAALDEGISLDPDEYDVLKDEYIALLKREFGDEYYKYYYEDVEEKAIPINNNDRASFEVPGTSDAMYQYFIWMQHKSDIWPWGGINVARTEFKGRSRIPNEYGVYPTTYFSAQYISVSLSDSLTPLKNASGNGYAKTTVYGNWNSGFLAPAAGSFKSIHTVTDSRVTGTSYTYSW